MPDHHAGEVVQTKEIANQEVTFTIADGADGSAVAAVSLGKLAWDDIVVVCEDCDGIQAATTLAVWVGYDTASQLVALYDQDDPGTILALGNLPATGTLAFLLTKAKGARRIRLVLSQATSGAAVVFKLYPIGAIGGDS